MKIVLTKKMPWWVTYPVLVTFSLTVVYTWGFFYVPRALGVVFPVGFEGTLDYVEYNCLCSGSIMLTVTPTSPASVARQGPQTNIMYYWAADAFSQIGGEIVDFPLPGPRIFPFYMIFTPGSQKLLGLYYPMSVPCVAYVGTACSITGYAQGVLILVGTSIY